MCYTRGMTDFKTPPSNTEAERAVLGSILLDARGRSGDRVMDLCLTGGIVPETFFDPRNRTVYIFLISFGNSLLITISLLVIG